MSHRLQVIKARQNYTGYDNFPLEQISFANQSMLELNVLIQKTLTRRSFGNICGSHFVHESV